MYLGESQSKLDWRDESRQRRIIADIKASAKVQFAYHVAVDLGKQRDRTVLTAIESQQTATDTIHIVKAIDILERNVSFTDQAHIIMAWLKKPCFNTWGVKTIIDSSGLGEPVCDYMQESGCKFKRATITSGDAAKHRDGKFYISRSKLIGTLISYLGKSNYLISSDVPHAPTFESEMLSLSIEFGKASGVSYVADGHDDVVISVALATFLLDRQARYRSGVRPLFHTK